MLKRLFFSLFFLSISFIAGLNAQTQEEIEGLLNPNSGEVKVKEQKQEKEKKVKEEKIVEVKAVKTDKLKTEKLPKTSKPIKISEEKVDKVKKEKESTDKLAKSKVEKVKSNKSLKEKETTTVYAKADSKYFRKAKANKKQGDKLLAKGSFYDATDFYGQAINQTKKKKLLTYLNYKNANTYFLLRDYSNAENYFNKALELDQKKNKYPLIEFQLANSLKHLEKYEEAKNTYRKFTEQEEKNKKLEFEKSKARLEVKGCDYAISFIAEEPLYSISNPGENINGPYADFGPEIKQNELVFSKILRENGDGNDFAKIYTAGFYKNEYDYAQKFAENVNKGDAYICNPSFSADGKTMFFTKCIVDLNLQSNCKIYESKLENGIWAEPVLLDENINETGANTSQPQIVIDENGNEILYFVAEREKGRGGKDIWFAVKNAQGEFGKSKNIGYPINTKYDDISPFYHTATQTLYYSTNGEISFGGFDVYKSSKIDEEWSEPLNMDKPVNSSLDDYDFVLSENEDIAYLVSNRIGTTTVRSETCCDDIFELRTTNIELFVQGITYKEELTERSLAKNSKIKLVNLAAPQNTQEINFNGDYFIFSLEKDQEYLLTATLPGFKDVKVSFKTNNYTKSDTLHYDLFFVDKSIVVAQNENKLLGTIYYEYNQARLTVEAPKTLSLVVNYLKENINANVLISSHTDDKGAESYNMKLSEERSLAAQNYLIFEGIDISRISRKWFGESKPIEPNSFENGEDNEKGRSLNRRTEFSLFKF